MPNEREVALNSIQLAEFYARKELPGRCFAHFLVALRLMPDWKNKYKTDFASALCEWGNRLETEERYLDLFTCYQQAIEIYPDNEIVLNNLGAHMFRLNCLNRSTVYFKKALLTNSDYLPAIRNLQNVSNFLVERWHFKMLNDFNRNDAFRKAISKKVQNGYKSVIDIGTGTGILSLYAVTEGAERVFACECSETMSLIAQKVFRSNIPNYSMPKLINKLSTSMVVPDDIPYRCSLVVTETADAGLLGEHMLQTLIHAWKNLLEGDNVKNAVIPLGAKLYAAPIECLKIARKFQILPKERSKSFNLNLDLSKIKLTFLKEEPYDTENLKKCKFNLLSEPKELFNFNFNDLKDMKEHLKGKKNSNIIFSCTTAGFLDAFAVWFDLYLDDEINITSSPFSSETCCWDQAIFPIPESVFMTKDMNLTLNAGCTNGILSVKINSVNDSKLSDQIVPSIPQSVIRYLNCSTYLDILNQNALKLIYNGVDRVVDFSPFPYCGVLFEKFCGAEVIVNKIGDNLKAIMDLLDVNSENFIAKPSGDNFFLLNRNTFDVVIVDPVESSGEFNDNLIINLPNIRGLLKPNGIIIPNKIHLWCQLIQSPQLINEFEVSDKNLHTNHKIAKFINEYKVTTLIDLNVNELDYIVLTDKTLVGTLDLENSEIPKKKIFENSIKINKTGRVNAILYWYSFQLGESTFSTLAEDSYVNQCAEISDNELNVIEDNLIDVQTILSDGIIRYRIKENSV